MIAYLYTVLVSRSIIVVICTANSSGLCVSNGFILISPGSIKAELLRRTIRLPPLPGLGAPVGRAGAVKKSNKKTLNYNNTGLICNQLSSRKTTRQGDISTLLKRLQANLSQH